MSEEKPTFKVRDRRLFNPDGTPREIEREEETTPDEQTTSRVSATTEADATAPSQARDAEASRDQRESARDSSSADVDASADKRDEASREEAGAVATENRRGSSQPEAESDPTAFANLVMFIASPAAAAMGMTEHPGMQPGELDLPLARHCIDLLVTVREKSRGNLGAQEQQILESLLAELQMQYVSLTGPRRPAAPRGFTGGDITGGR